MLNANVDPFIFCNFDWHLVFITECEFPVTLLESLRAPSNSWTCHLKPAKIKLCKILQTDICILGDTNWGSTIQASMKNFTILQTISSFVFNKKNGKYTEFKVFFPAVLGPVVWKMDNAIHWINLYPVYGAIGFVCPPAKMVSLTVKRSIGPCQKLGRLWGRGQGVWAIPMKVWLLQVKFILVQTEFFFLLWIIGARKQRKFSFKQG